MVHPEPGVELVNRGHRGNLVPGDMARIHPERDVLPANWLEMTPAQLRALPRDQWAAVLAARAEVWDAAPLAAEVQDPRAVLRAVDELRLAQQQARREAQLRDCCIRYGFAVVVMLIALSVLLVLVLSEIGSGKPDSGGAFVDGSARLRKDVLGALSSARPTACGWSAEAADDYAGIVRRQHARVTAMAAADRQAADAVATQAAVVEQARWTLEVALVALAGAIAVAKVLEAKWKAALVAGSVLAPAFGMALLAFGGCVALPAITAGVDTLIAMGNAGHETKKVLDDVTGLYRRVVDDRPASTLAGPTGW